MNSGVCLRSLSGLLPATNASRGPLKGLSSRVLCPSRNVTTTETGGVLPMPHKTRFGLLGIACTVIPGLLIGATISKKMANFLEENELFVPSDDDDDDD